MERPLQNFVRIDWKINF